MSVNNLSENNMTGLMVDELKPGETTFEVLPNPGSNFPDLIIGLGHYYVTLENLGSIEISEVVACSSNQIQLGRRGLENTSESTEPFKIGSLVQVRPTIMQVKELSATMHDSEEAALTASTTVGGEYILQCYNLDGE